MSNFDLQMVASSWLFRHLQRERFDKDTLIMFQKDSLTSDKVHSHCRLLSVTFAIHGSTCM